MITLYKLTKLLADLFFPAVICYILFSVTGQRVYKFHFLGGTGSLCSLNGLHLTSLNEADRNMEGIHLGFLFLCPALYLSLNSLYYQRWMLFPCGIMIGLKYLGTLVTFDQFCNRLGFMKQSPSSPVVDSPKAERKYSWAGQAIVVSSGRETKCNSDLMCQFSLRPAMHRHAFFYYIGLVCCRKVSLWIFKMT